MSRGKVKRHVEQLRGAEADLAKAVDAALESADAFNAALETPGLPVARLARLAWKASRDASAVWTAASWTVEERRNLRAVRAGRRVPTGPALPPPRA